MYLPSDNPSSLVGWFRRGVGVTASGGFASAWADQSGAGHDLLQATGTNQPAYDGSAILTFDGVDNFMATGNFTLAQPMQISMLVEQISWTSNDTFFVGNTAIAQLFQSTASPQLSMYAGLIAIANTDLTVGVFNALAALFNGASSSIQIGSNAAVTGNASGLGMGGFRLGNDGSGANFANIAVKEIIIRNVDDATIRANDQTYLINLQNDVTPVADFSGTPLTGTPGLSVAFTDASTNSPRTWAWDFGDGQTSTSQNPTHTYANSGTYTVILTATNYGGSNAATKTSYISVSSSGRQATAPNLPGGGSGGLVGRRTSQALLRKRQRREEDEVAMILEAVLPLLDGQVGEAKIITLKAKE